MEPRACVLVVDDDHDFRTSVVEILEDAGYDVSQAANGQEALELLEQEGIEPAVILVDLMMPVMNGWQLIDHLRNHGSQPPIPVVLISAFEPSLRTLAWKVAGTLAKPIPSDVLLAMVERFTKQST